MPLSRPALSVGTGPRSVQRARRWVVDTLSDIDRTELLETAELGTSELVTNAVLHAAAPISVRVRGTREHPRVEVRDGSVEPPQLPDPESLAPGEGDPTDIDEDSLLVTFGRGLDIVARCADAWGAEIENAGKVVWFNPALRPRDRGVEGRLTGLEHQVVPDPDAVHYRLLAVPLHSLAEFEVHYRELRREVRLLALAHGDEYPLARHLSDLFGRMQRELRDGLPLDEVQAAREAGRETVDLTIRLSPVSAESMGRFVELLDFADDFCRQQRLLSLARSDEQRTFQTWFLTEIVRQQEGEDPVPYSSQMRLRA